MTGLVSEWSLGQFVGKRTHDLYFNTTPAGLHSFLELLNFNIDGWIYAVFGALYSALNE